MFKTSAFKLQLYETCPQQYKFVYVDKIADQYATAKPYLTMGSHVHNALHDFYGKFPAAGRTWDCLQNLLRTRWRQNRSGFLDRNEERRWGLKALQMLRLFFEKMDVSITPVMLEDYYSFDIDKTLSVIGRIDRVDELDGGWHVIDYKTGIFSEEDVNEMQLLLYSLIISRSTGKKVVKASFLYLPSFTWYTIEPEPEDYDYIIEQVKLKVKKIMEDQQFQPRVNKYCRHCDFLEICPAKEDALELIRLSNTTLTYGSKF